MIKNYLYAIGKYLPVSKRNDILKEIESVIYDYLETEYGKKKYTNKEIEKAITSMGNPKQVAYAFSETKKNLIDPIYLDLYFLIIKFSIFGLSIAFAVLAVLSFVESESILESLLQFLSNIWNTGIMLIGSATLIFWFISNYIPKKVDIFNDEEDWSVKDLEKAPEDAKVVKPSTLIIEIVFIILFLITINSYSSIIGAFPKIQMTLNTNVLSSFIGWINITLIINLFLNIIVLIKKEWSTQTRIFVIIINIIKVMIFGAIAFSPKIFVFANDTILSADVIESINTGTSIGFRIGFLAVLVITVIESFQQIKSIFKK